jgi:hypothetical protein
VTRTNLVHVIMITQVRINVAKSESTPSSLILATIAVTMQEESTLMGSIYVSWAEQNRLWRAEIEEGFSLTDLLVELGTLEEKGLGRKVHGR